MRQRTRSLAAFSAMWWVDSIPRPVTWRHHGFHTATGGPVRLDVPRRRPQVAILGPVEGRTVRTDGTVQLWGIVTSSDGRRLPDDAIRWELDGEPVGGGTEVWVELPGWEGEHRCTLVATDSDLRAEASVMFQTTASGRPPHRASRD